MNRALLAIFKFSGEFVFQYEPRFTGKEQPIELSIEAIKNVKSNYSEYVSDFIDDVFGNESTLEREDF